MRAIKNQVNMRVLGDRCAMADFFIRQRQSQVCQSFWKSCAVKQMYDGHVTLGKKGLADRVPLKS